MARRTPNGSFGLGAPSGLWEQLTYGLTHGQAPEVQRRPSSTMSSTMSSTVNANKVPIVYASVLLQIRA